MTDRKLAEHLAEQVVEVLAMRYGLEIGPVFGGGSLQVQAVCSRVIEVVAFPPPDLAINLRPLGFRIDADFQVARLESAFAGFYGRRGRNDSPAFALMDESLLAVEGHAEIADILRVLL